MRVQLVVGRYRPDRDGVSAYVQRLAGALPGVDVEADVIEWPGGARWAGRGLRHRADGRRGRVDLVHVQFAPSAYGYSGGIGFLPLAVGERLVTTLHEYGWWSWRPGVAQVPGPVRAGLERGWDLGHRLAERTGRWDRETLLLAPASRELVVTGAGHASTVSARLGRHPVVIPIGANVGVAYHGTRAAARRELNVAGDGPVLAFFGFVHPVKGLRYLLEAMAQLRAGAPGLQLALIGGWRSLAWPDAEADAFVADLRTQAERAGLADAVRFPGFLPEEEASRWLVAADVAVLPFTAGVTAKSGSLLTCWAHRLPVVATAPPDGPDPDVVGAVEPAAPRDVATLRDAIAHVLADRSLRTRLVAAGQHRMAPRRWPEVAVAHRRLYERVLAR